MSGKPNTQNTDLGEAPIRYFTPTPSGRSSEYKPIELTSAWVFENAHLLTQEQMARMFCIDRNTLLKHFGKEFNAGKEMNKYRRRVKFEEFLRQLEQTEEYNHCNKNAKSNEYIKAYEVWSKCYDGYGQPAPEAETGIQAEVPTWTVEPPKFEAIKAMTASEKAEIEGLDE